MLKILLSKQVRCCIVDRITREGRVYRRRDGSHFIAHSKFWALFFHINLD